MNFGYLALETKRAVRSSRIMMTSVAIPALLFLVYISIFPGQPQGLEMSFATYLVPTLAALGAYQAAFIYCAQTAIERSTGWQRQLRLTPLTTPSYVAAKVVVGMGLAIIPIAVVCVLGRLNSKVEISGTAWVQIIVGIWLSSLPFALMGLAIGQTATARNLPAFMNGFLTPLSLLGGLLIPIALFPAWMVTQAKLLPTYWIGEIGRGALFGNTQFPMAIAALAAWSALAAGVVAWRYQRNAERV